MKRYAYRALFEPGDRRGNIVVTFPDVPEVITQGRGKADAQSSAEEALGLALLSYPARGSPLPKARASGKKLVAVAVAVAADVAAKLAVLETFVAAGISKSELARRIGKDEKEVRRILDPKHATKLPALTAALRALGKRLVVGVMKAEAA